MLNSLKIILQYNIPKVWINQLAGWIANKKLGWLTKLAIDLFVKYYRIDMNETQELNTASYLTFNEFFTRKLRDGVRPLNKNSNIVVFPADGIISQLGKIKKDKILQAKGFNYSLESLFAGNCSVSDKFIDGTFVTTYLPPYAYHRVHMPCDGTLREVIYIPGDLFSVNHLTTNKVPNLLARNERVICLFNTEFGLMAQILVGSIIVGSIETVWNSSINSPREGIVKRWTWRSSEKKDNIRLIKGQEMGCFKLGSTVIVLFMRDKVSLVENLKNLSIAKIGKEMATSFGNKGL